MSIVQVQIPDSLHKSLYDLAIRDGISIDQFISTAIAEKLSALMTENYLKLDVQVLSYGSIPKTGCRF